VRSLCGIHQPLDGSASGGKPLRKLDEVERVERLEIDMRIEPVEKEPGILFSY
jgi:hypothetical protein